MEVQEEVGGPRGPCGLPSCFTGFPKDKSLESWEGLGKRRNGKARPSEERGNPGSGKYNKGRKERSSGRRHLTCPPGIYR